MWKETGSGGGCACLPVGSLVGHDGDPRMADAPRNRCQTAVRELMPLCGDWRSVWLGGGDAVTVSLNGRWRRNGWSGGAVLHLQ
jgi:hypothetical protein